MREVIWTAPFDKRFRKLPERIRRSAYQKITQLQQDPTHSSLRLKRIRGPGDLWEISVTMNYRITLELTQELIILRRIGTHDILRSP
jgi:mRNA-degrading endonuclease RelE of RelBE toxin-antitoxin system